MKRMLLITAAVAALAVGLIAVGGASAQEGGRPDVVGDFVTRLAERLGISEENLTGAVKDVEIDMVNDAVSEGRLTEEQGAAIIDRIENGDLRFPGAGPRGHVRCQAVRFVGAAAAEVLGLENEELKAKLQDGMSLAEIAQEQGMTVDDFSAALIAEVEAGLQEKVDEGKLTQEQADKLLEGFTSRVDKIVNYHPEPGSPGPCQRHHGQPPEGEPAPES